jgi:exodeoxyribonuclease-3
MVKIISWNVNGLRAIIAKGMMEAIARQDPDVMCLQEIKTGRGFPSGAPDLVLPQLPCQFFCPADRPGYAGTAILTRSQPLSWARGIGSRVSDAEGRVVTVEFSSLYIVSVYVPNSQRGLPRLGFRLRWDAQFRRYLRELAERKPVVFCGDMNVAHREIDIARPNDNRMNAGFTDQERRSFTRLLGQGFVDTFRFLHPDEADRYSWWSYATRARERNIGWRIDYVCVSRGLEPRLRDAFILDAIQGSDHCPVGAVLDGDL